MSQRWDSHGYPGRYWYDQGLHYPQQTQMPQHPSAPNFHPGYPGFGGAPWGPAGYPMPYPDGYPVPLPGPFLGPQCAGPTPPAAPLAPQLNGMKSFHGKGKVVWHYIYPGGTIRYVDGHVDESGVEHRNWIGPTAYDIQIDNFRLDARSLAKKKRDFAPKVDKLSDCFWVMQLDGTRDYLPFQTIESSLTGNWHQDPWSGNFYFVCAPSEKK